MREQKYKLTPDQFDALRKKLDQRIGSERFDDDNIAAACTVMVGGESVTKAAETSGQSRQNLHRVVRDLWAIFNDVEPPSRVMQRQNTLKSTTPKSWVKVTVTLPPDLAKAVQELEKKARSELND